MIGRRAGLIGLVAVWLIGCSAPVQPDLQRLENSLRVASYNVHYIVDRPEGEWGLRHWDRRKVALAEAVKALNADVIAFQEMETWGGSDDDSNNRARPWLLEQLPDMTAGAIGPWQQFPSTQPVFYRTDRFALLDQGFFMFGPTPEVPYSPTFNQSWSAFASWVHLQRKSDGSAFRVINLHTDYASRSNRLQSMALVNQRVQPWLDEPLLVVGDFNALHGWDELTQLQGVTFPKVQGSTYHLNRGWHVLPAIDHLGHRNLIRLQGPYVDQRRFQGVLGSDHYPVWADYRLN